MAKKYVLKSNVIHDGKKLEKGKLCPDELVSKLAPGLLEEVPEAPKEQERASKEEKKA